MKASIKCTFNIQKQAKGDQKHEKADKCVNKKFCLEKKESNN